MYTCGVTWKAKTGALFLGSARTYKVDEINPVCAVGEIDPVQVRRGR